MKNWWLTSQIHYFKLCNCSFINFILSVTKKRVQDKNSGQATVLRKMLQYTHFLREFLIYFFKCIINYNINILHI